MNFLEKELEGWCVDHFSEFAACLPPSHRQPNYHLLGTQVPCAYGTIDMLIAWYCHPIVIEFKAIPAKPKSVAQLHRYCHAVREVLQDMKVDIGFDTGTPELFSFYTPPVIGYLVAPSFDDDTLLALQTIGWAVMVTQSSTGFQFSNVEMPRPKDRAQLKRLLQPLAQGAIGREIGEMMRRQWRDIGVGV